MKFTKRNIDDFKRNEISKNESRKIIGGNNLEDSKDRNLTSLFEIDPPLLPKPPGQS